MSIMNRRFFFGMLVPTAFSLAAITQQNLNQVRLVSYVDAKYVGRTFKIGGHIRNPPILNKHYRPAEQLIAISGDGVVLHVYSNEIEMVS